MDETIPEHERTATRTAESTGNDSAAGLLSGPPSARRVADHLANERTFLSWIRTALALIGLGFILARVGLFLEYMSGLDSVPDAARPIGPEFVIVGLVFLGMGVMVAGWSGWLYQHARRAIDARHYQPAHRAVLALTFLVAFGGVVIFVLVLSRLFVGDGTAP